MPWELCPKVRWRVSSAYKVKLWGLKGQFYVKKAKFRGLIDKIDHYRPILTTRTHLQPIFIDYGIRNCTINYVGVVLELRKLDFGGLKGQFDAKEVNFRV